MADSRIQNLTEDTALVDTDWLVAEVGDSEARKVSVANLRSSVLGAGSITAAMFATGIMPWTELYDETLAGAAASIDSGAGGFSTTLDHMLIILYLRTTEAVVSSQTNLRFNNDSTAAAYNRQSVRGINVTASAGQGIGQAQMSFFCAGSSAQSGVFSASLFCVPAYSQTTGHKMVIGVNGWSEETAADQLVEGLSGHWENTAAITRVQVLANSGNYAAGSRMTVYGIG